MNLQELNDLDSWEWPDDAATLVLDTLANKSAPGEDRVLAARLAGDMVILSEEVADILLGILQSMEEPDELRSAAAISIGPGLEEAEYGDYGDPEDVPAFSQPFVKKIQRALQRLYQDPGIAAAVRRSILESSVRSPQAWHADAIRTAYTANTLDWQITAVFCMGFVKGFEAEIFQSLQSADPAIHLRAVEAAGNWEMDEAWPHIAELVLSPETEKALRIAAIWAAASIRPHESEMLEPLVDSYDEDIAEAAMDALSEAGFAEDWDSEPEEDIDFEDHKYDNGNGHKN